MNPRLALVAVFAMLLHPHLTGQPHGLGLTIPPSWLGAIGVLLAAFLLAFLATRAMGRITVRGITT